jgi:hypothetical protein
MAIENKMNTLNPVVVSASRSTDIPAFYADWMLSRLQLGYCTWINPFNRAEFNVSFKNTRLIVFWSKNPMPMLERLAEIEALGFRQYYFQFTLNDYVAEGLEPNVPKVETRIDTFRRLADRIGKERVIWRFDPLLLTDKISIDVLLERIGTIGRQLKGYTNKLVFSFIDIVPYRKVQRNLAGLGCREFTIEMKLKFAEGLVRLNEELGLDLATCAEDVDLSDYGITHNKCIDDELMLREFNADTKLMDFIGAERDIFGRWTIRKSKKDKGQRKNCGCVSSKDIGMYNTCPHLCRYCYANTTDSAVLANCAQYRIATQKFWSSIQGDEQ